MLTSVYAGSHRESGVTASVKSGVAEEWPGDDDE